MPGGEGRGGRAGDDLRRARLQGENLLDGPQGRGRRAPDSRQAESRLPHRQDGPLRRLDGRLFDVDVCRHAPAACRRPGGDERHGQPPGVRKLPGGDSRVVRRRQGGNPPGIQKPQRRILAGAAHDADRLDHRRQRQIGAAGQRGPAGGRAQEAPAERAPDPPARRGPLDRL